MNSLEVRIENLEKQVQAIATRNFNARIDSMTADLADSKSASQNVMTQYDSIKNDLLNQNLAFEALMTELLPELTGGED